MSRMKVKLLGWLNKLEKLHLWHGVYIFLLMAIALGRLAQKITTDSGGFVSRYLPIFAVSLLITSYVGYVSKTPILSRVFWQCVFWCFFIVDIALLLYVLYLLLGPMNMFIVYIFIALLLVTMPAQLALYRYSKQQCDIWS